MCQKKLLFLLAVLWVFNETISLSIAAELVFDKDHSVTKEGSIPELHWRVNSDNTGSLVIYNTESVEPIAEYDITRCLFCAGGEDNCDSDGIFNISSIVDLNEPTIGLVCHVGAHSQQLRIFQPMIDQENAINIYTGSYYINYEINQNGLIIIYDVYMEGGNFQSKTVYWP